MSKSRTNSKSQERPAWLIPAFIAGAVVVFLAIIAVLVTNRGGDFEPEVTGAPRAVFDQLAVDHGSIPFEQPVESVFRVRNVGDRALAILGEPRVELVEGC